MEHHYGRRAFPRPVSHSWLGAALVALATSSPAYCCRYACDSALLGLYTLSGNTVPPGDPERPGTHRHRVTSPYAAPLVEAGALPGVLTHTTDTHAGSRFEHVSFTRFPNQTAGSGATPSSWINYAERDAFRAMAEAHFLLPPKQTVRIHST